MKISKDREHVMRAFSIATAFLFILMALAVVDWSTGSGDATDSTTMDMGGKLQGTYDLKDDPGDQLYHQTNRYARFGSNLATGDVNGDGEDDLIVDQAGYYYNGPKIYVFFGMTHFDKKVTTGQADTQLSVPGGYDYSDKGNSIACGDVNGDGIDDIVLGAWTASSDRGEVHIHFGRTTWPSSVNTPDVRITNEDGSYYRTRLGEDVWCDDFDGDGIDDVVAVEPYWYESNVDEERYNGEVYDIDDNYTGLAFIFWGRGTSSWPSNIDLDTADPETDLYLRIKGWSPGPDRSYRDRQTRLGYDSGQAIHSGDFNGDGRTDVVLSSYYSYLYTSDSSYEYRAGAVWILEGRTRAQWMQWSGQYDMLARNGDYIMFMSEESSGYWGYNPRLGDLNGDGIDDLVISSYRNDGGWRIVFGQTNTSSLKSNFESSYPHGGYFNILEDNYDVHVKVPSGASYSSGGTWVDDVDGDGIDDLIMGEREKDHRGNYRAGQVALIYGMKTWPASTSFDSNDALFLGAYRYGYMGNYQAQSIMTGDFNNDDIPDLLLGAMEARVGGNYYAGAVHLIFSYPPQIDIHHTEILDADGYDGKTVVPGSGGIDEDTENPIGDGIYTISTGYNNSWIAEDTKEFRLNFQLKGAFKDFKYTFGFALANKSFYVIDNPLGGVILEKGQCSFNRTSFTSVHLNFSFNFTDEFLTQELFDLVLEAEREGYVVTHTMEDFLHVEKDITFLGDDFVVTRDGNPISRGAFLSGGSPLMVTGLQVAYEGTEVAPMNEKFFVRITDSYSRIFEDRDSAGREVHLEIPTTVDSGVYKFNIEILITSDYLNYVQATTIVPMFYLNLDLTGPEAPTNVRFHADGIDDPENRWDDDNEVWLSWDPAYDTQQGILNYYVEIITETRATEVITLESDQRSINLTLPGSGLVKAKVYSSDESNNIGETATTSIIIDTEDLTVNKHLPTYQGGVWFRDTTVGVKFNIHDLSITNNGPKVDFSTLQYKVTSEMSLASRDAAEWEDVELYRIIDQRRVGVNDIYMVEASVDVDEGKDNYVWFKVSDEVGNEGMTTLFDIGEHMDETDQFLEGKTSWTEQEKAEYRSNALRNARKMANETNPALIWVDKTPLTFSSPTPTSDPLEENSVSASIQVNDMGSKVDASTIQYSVSRNGIANYGGWINIDTAVDDSTILAETVMPLLLQPGSTNYIRWRAKDVAGNGYTVSDDHAIIIEALPVNNPPVAVIDEPKMNDVFDTKDGDITFSAVESSDQDEGDELGFKWILANRTVISEEEQFTYDADDLGPGPHVFSLEVSDGQVISTTSISIYVKLHPDEVDTDGDGEPDGSDLDDDGDGLLDSIEEEMGTNPRLRDTDQDGKDDSLDPEPMNPLVVEEEDEGNDVSYYSVLSLLIILAVLILLIGSLLVLRKRSNMERERTERAVISEGKILSRYEDLTGVSSPLLPQVKEMGLSLPPVAAQNVAPMKKARELQETPSLPSKEEKEGEKEEKKAEPMQAPEPTPAPAPATEQKAPEPEKPQEKKPKPKRRVRKKTAGKPAATTPDEMRKPEDLTKSEALPGTSEEKTEDEGGSEGSTATCDLCGSSIDVPPGASSVECPLCGERKEL